MNTRVKVGFGATLALLLVFFAASPMTCVLRLRDDVELGFDALRACAEVEALLGGDPRPAWVGLVGGKIALGPTGSSSHQYPVVGSKAEGTYFFITADERARPTLSSAWLTVGRTRIDVVACNTVPG